MKTSSNPISKIIINNYNSRQIALERYYENPKICLQCQSVINVPENIKIAQVRLKKFCNHNCAAIFNNSKRKKKERVKKPKVVKFNPLIGITKGDLFTIRKSWQHARSDIRKHACYIYKQNVKQKTCFNCGYEKHIEIAHIKAVSDFSDDILITVINDPSNLIGLCPNCHWEFDNGFLKLNNRGIEQR